MKFQLLLWGIGYLMKRASRNNSEFINKLEGQDMVFEIGSDDGVCRNYQISNQKITSKSGTTVSPEFALRFKTAADGFRILTAKNAKKAFMEGFQSKLLRVEGNPASLIWFQSTIGLVLSKNKKSSSP